MKIWSLNDPLEFINRYLLKPESKYASYIKTNKPAKQKCDAFMDLSSVLFLSVPSWEKLYPFRNVRFYQLELTSKLVNQRSNLHLPARLGRCKKCLLLRTIFCKKKKMRRLATANFYVTIKAVYIFNKNMEHFCHSEVILQSWVLTIVRSHTPEPSWNYKGSFQWRTSF